MEVNSKQLSLATFATYSLCLLTFADAVYRLMVTLKPHSNGPLYNSTVIGTLAVDGLAVTFGAARRGLGGLRPRSVPSSLYQM